MLKTLRHRHKKLLITFGVCIPFIIFFIFCLPHPLFDDPLSAVILDRQGNMLGARIAADGQWRFPQMETVPEKFEAALLAFEDKRFRYHAGIDPMAICRALKQNIEHGRAVSGGSTITMQVIRLSRRGQDRNIGEKILEAVMAVRLETKYSKDQILALYTSFAPFGGNVVGLEAAAWRYFGRSAANLSWSEAATLAVLPNAPALMHPGRNRIALQAKRDRLLQKLADRDVISQQDGDLAKAELLLEKPLPLPSLSPHLLAGTAAVEGTAALHATTIDLHLQQRVNSILQRHQETFSQNHIYNAAAIVADIETGEVLAYSGNTNMVVAGKGQWNDMIKAARSTGSLLKPLLYAAMLNEGYLLPNTLVPDIPTQISGYVPKNFDEKFQGAVRASEAVARSLNVPCVRMLRDYSYEKFHYLLQRLGMTTLDKPAGHYGLTMILGGSEGTLWDMAGMYASLARRLNHYQSGSLYAKNDLHPLTTDLETSRKWQSEEKTWSNESEIGAGATWQMFNAMQEVKRPEDEFFWRQFSSSRQIAWKTGTSYGFRDGWAIGITPTHVVGVWVGNADGEGRPDLTGIATAGPLLFEIFDLLPETGWFPTPFDDLKKTATCRQSGYLPGPACDEIDTLLLPSAAERTDPCPYHILLHLDGTQQYQVNSHCESPSDMIHKSWFILPPVQEWYFRNHNSDYLPLPPFRKDCDGSGGTASVQAMELIYPGEPARIYVPREVSGQEGRTVFEVAHRNQHAEIFWHLDDKYVGNTRHIHQIALNPAPGPHLLSLTDSNGERLELKFRIIERDLD
ncbi:MAG: penicillin-binding protein 1C [Bacteroidia bacterium]